MSKIIYVTIFLFALFLFIFGLLSITLIIPAQYHPESSTVFNLSDNAIWQIQGFILMLCGGMFILYIVVVEWLGRWRDCDFIYDLIDANFTS